MKSVPRFVRTLFVAMLLAPIGFFHAQAIGAPGGGGGGGGGGGNSGCSFDATRTVGLNFGTLDPSIGATVTAIATIYVGNCAPGLTMAVSVDNGQRGNLTMIRDGGTETIQYGVSAPSFSPGTASGPGVGSYKAATITGTIQPSAYQDAKAGTYRDILTVTVTP